MGGKWGSKGSKGKAKGWYNGGTEGRNDKKKT